MGWVLYVRALSAGNWTEIQYSDKTGVMINRAQQAVLRVLFTMASEGCPADRFLLAAELGLSDREVDVVLEQLDRAGLVDARRVRLTMIGLAVAVNLPRARDRLAYRGASAEQAA